MRDAFIRGLLEVAERDDRVMLLTADLGFKIFDRFAERFPGRFLNMGVAEANMAGVSAGLAMSGLRPFIYSIVPFVAMRCYEQIRDDICYHNVPVTIVGVGGGYSYGHCGPTHHALEDVALMRLLPNMTVIAPGDPAEVQLAVRASAQHSGPLYLRLGRAGDPAVHREAPAFAIGRAIVVREGKDCSIIATGGMLPVAVSAAEELRRGGIEAEVVSMHTVKPLDEELVRERLQRRVPLFTLEEHFRTGGLGSAVAELAASSGAGPVERLGVGDEFAHLSGNQEYLRAAQGLSAEQVAERIRLALEGAAR
jgi:transketolase